jgi:hypothetical protein
MDALLTPVEAVGEPSLGADLAALASRRILFGHQSIGMNLLRGIAAITAAHSGPSLRIVETSEDAGPGAIAHIFLPRNGAPELKLSSFQRALESAAGRSADVALMKLCYADFTDRTDVHALFARYRATMSGLRRTHGSVTFAHVTVPLTTVRERHGARSVVAALAGRESRAVRENARREEFNDLIRRTYGASGLVFDLARLESTAPDGSSQLHRGDGRLVPALCSAYTDDGSHLNQPTAERIGRGLIAFLANVATQ